MLSPELLWYRNNEKLKEYIADMRMDLIFLYSVKDWVELVYLEILEVPIYELQLHFEEIYSDMDLTKVFRCQGYVTWLLKVYLPCQDDDDYDFAKSCNKPNASMVNRIFNYCKWILNNTYETPESQIEKRCVLMSSYIDKILNPRWDNNDEHLVVDVKGEPDVFGNPIVSKMEIGNIKREQPERDDNPKK